MLSREYDQEAAALVQKNSTKEDSVARAKIVSDGNLDTKDYEELFLLSFKPSAYNKDNVAKINLNLPDNFGAASNALFTGLMKDASMNANLYDSLPSLKFPVINYPWPGRCCPTKLYKTPKRKFTESPT